MATNRRQSTRKSSHCHSNSVNLQMPSFVLEMSDLSFSDTSSVTTTTSAVSSTRTSPRTHKRLSPNENALPSVSSMSPTKQPKLSSKNSLYVDSKPVQAVKSAKPSQEMKALLADQKMWKEAEVADELRRHELEDRSSHRPMRQSQTQNEQFSTPQMVKKPKTTRTKPLPQTERPDRARINANFDKVVDEMATASARSSWKVRSRPCYAEFMEEEPEDAKEPKVTAAASKQPPRRHMARTAMESASKTQASASSTPRPRSRAAAAAASTTKKADKVSIYKEESSSSSSSESESDSESDSSLNIVEEAESPNRNTRQTPLKTSKTPSKRPLTVKKGAHLKFPVSQSASQRSVVPKTISKLSGTENRLLCREEQHDFVKQFLVDSLLAEVSRSLYISGVPGTGKTATVNQVVGELSSVKNLPKFQFIEVNGMRLTDPNQVFVEIYRELRKVQDRLESVALVPRVSVEAARRSLNELFDRHDPLRMPVVLLVDELDLLCTRRQHVLYELFDWATRDTARLIVLAIANTLDLPERLLTQRVNSRMGMARLSFQPYDHKQIKVILQHMFGAVDKPDDKAVEFIARKVAAVSGDLRKALEIYRRSRDMAKQDRCKITLKLVQDAMRALSTTVRNRAILSASTHAQLLLKAAATLTQRTGVAELKLQQVIAEYYILSNLDGYAALKLDRINACLHDLCASGLLLMGPHGGDCTRQLCLKVVSAVIMIGMSKMARPAVGTLLAKGQSVRQGHGPRVIYVRDPVLGINRMKDMVHFYCMCPLLALLSAYCGVNVVYGPCELQENPGKDEAPPHSYQFERTPLRQWMAKYTVASDMEHHEREMAKLFGVQVRQVWRREEWRVRSLMSQRLDYAAWSYFPLKQFFVEECHNNIRNLRADNKLVVHSQLNGLN